VAENQKSKIKNRKATIDSSGFSGFTLSAGISFSRIRTSADKFPIKQSMLLTRKAISAMGGTERGRAGVVWYCVERRACAFFCLLCQLMKTRSHRRCHFFCFSSDFQFFYIYFAPYFESRPAVAAAAGV